MYPPPWESVEVSSCATARKPCCLCDCERGLQKRGRKKVAEVSGHGSALFFSPRLPLECDCRLLRRNWVFQGQPSLSKLALRATGRTRTPPASLGPVLVCKGRGGASQRRIHIWGGGGVQHESFRRALLIYGGTLRRSE